MIKNWLSLNFNHISFLMKLLLLGLLFFSSLANSQETIFQTSVDSKNLNNVKKISEDLNSTYKKTYYFNQNNFDLKQNLNIILPNNKKIVAIYQKSITYPVGSYSSIYKIKDDSNAELVFSEYDNVITGMYVSSENSKYVFQQTSTNSFAVSEVNEKSFKNKEQLIDYEINADDFYKKSTLINNDVCAEGTPICPGKTTIDIMVVYTLSASILWGGDATSKSTITTSITNMNVALLNSGISNITFNLVYSDVVNYVETDNFQTDLVSLRSSTDGILDEIHTIRADYGADLVGLVLGSPTSSCGRGNLNTSPTNYSNRSSFVVNLYSCVLSNFSLAHEFGHNMGLNHDWFVNQETLPCSHHHGYINRSAIINGTSSTASQRWRTIMSYSDECAAKGIGCSRINRWANPNVTYNSESTGIAVGQTNPSDEAFGFRRFACIVSDFMPTVLTNNEFNQKIFSVYPNPSKNTITINSNFEIDDIAIFNTIGQLVLNSKQSRINIEMLQKGVYFVKILTADGNIVGVKKIFKE